MHHRLPFSPNTSDKHAAHIKHGDCAQVFACTVGQKPSKAPFYLNDTSEVAHLLSRLADLGAPLPPPLPPSLMPIVQRPRRMQVDASS